MTSDQSDHCIVHLLFRNILHVLPFVAAVLRTPRRRTLRRYCVPLCAPLLMVLSTGQVLGSFVVTSQQRPLYVAEGEQFDPRISGERVVFTDFWDGPGDIILISDLTVDPAPYQRLTDTPLQEKLNDIDGTRVVYTRVGADLIGDIVARDIVSGDINLVPDGFNDALPRVSGNYVVFQRLRDDWDIFGYEINTSSVFPIADGLGDQLDPAISGRRIVYRDGDVIRLFDFSGGGAPVVSTLAPGEQPDIEGDRIVYAAQDSACAGCGLDVFLYDITAGTSVNLTQRSGNQTNPSIFGDYVGYDDNSAGNLDVWVYFISYDHHEQMSSNVADQFLADVGDGRIVYTDDRNGDWDIFVTDFELIRDPGQIAIRKTTDGAVDPTQDWTFTLYAGADGFDGTALASDKTLGDPDGVLDFEERLFDTVDKTYTLCEIGVPAGWTSTWMIDTDDDGVPDTTIIPYNPNGDDDPPKDLGHRCFDFGVDTGYAIPAEGILVWHVDNSYPGGDPRAAGYWKNWNTCTAGNQAATAANNGGPAEGWFLLDDILNDPGIIWDGFQILTCEDGVSILDQRDLSTGKKRANDAAYTLASHLLSAQLNFAAGAATCAEALDTALAGENLLAGLGFNGTGTYLRPKNAEWANAIALASTLAQYNNGDLCVL